MVAATRPPTLEKCSSRLDCEFEYQGRVATRWYLGSVAPSATYGSSTHVFAYAPGQGVTGYAQPLNLPDDLLCLRVALEPIEAAAPDVASSPVSASHILVAVHTSAVAVAQGSGEAPKPPRSALRCFMRNHVRGLRKKHPGAPEGQLRQILTAMFEKAPPEERREMERRSRLDKFRYEHEYAEYLAKGGAAE